MSNNVNSRFDIIICGLGLSGLSIATELALQDSFDAQVLLVEPNSIFEKDKIWCCWNTTEHLMTDRVSHRWNSWRIKLGQHEVIHHSDKYCYEQIDSDVFYKFCLNKVREADNFTLRLGSSVSNIREGNENTAYVTIDNTQYETKKAFDSRPANTKDRQLLQHFKGWHIVSKKAVFDPTTVTLMDFKNCKNSVNFFYILPYSTTEALVENTYFSHDLLPMQKYEEELIQYIEKDLGCSSWDIQREEYGVIPMHITKTNIAVDNPLVKIGVTAGFAKASTGYCYSNTQRFAQHMAHVISNNGTLGRFKLRDSFGGYLDTIFTRYLSHQSENVPQTIFDLFRLNSADRVVRFLSDMPTVRDYLGIMRSMPKQAMLLEAYRNTRNYDQQSFA